MANGSKNNFCKWRLKLPKYELRDWLIPNMIDWTSRYISGSPYHESLVMKYLVDKNSVKKRLYMKWVFYWKHGTKFFRYTLTEITAIPMRKKSIARHMSIVQLIINIDLQFRTMAGLPVKISTDEHFVLGNYLNSDNH